jgi:glycosyltransferase involved in cell wall biosynthesis
VSSRARVALVCTGLGYVNRGFERMTRDLFDAYGGDERVLLFKGDGEGSEQEVALRVPHRTGLLRTLGPERAYHAELAAFAALLVPQLVRRRIGLVHYLEPYLGNVLAGARRTLPLRFRLLLTDGLGLTVRSGSRADVLHVLTPLAREEAVRGGRADGDVVAIPAGVRADRFGGVSKADARAQLGLPAEARIVVEVAALNRRHKRVDFLIEEVARLGDGTMLLLDGAPEEPELIEVGSRLLGDRFRYQHVESLRVPLLYAAGDVFVHAALEEGYGLAAVEAMAAGLPVVMHDTPHFRWLVGDERQLVDFREPGALRRGLEQLPPNAAARNRHRAGELDWTALRPQYLEMYERILARPR